MRSVRVFLPVVLLVFAVSCTENTFVDEEDISPRTIRGRVLLEDGSNPEGIFVWLEDVRVSTWTDKEGRFALSLPSSPGGSGARGHEGSFSLYFYVANYGIETAQVVLVNGDVVKSRGDLDDQRKLKDVVYLKRILNIDTRVNPGSFPRHFRGEVVVSVTLQALSHEVTVESLTRVQNQVLKRSGLIIVDEAGMFINTIGQGPWWKLSPERITRDGKSLNMVLTWPPCDLLDGQYTMIPYLLVRQENLRPELLEDMGEGVGELGPNYLTLPFRRGGGEFLISQ